MSTVFVPSIEEIVFEHRNKEYGAYQLRKDYNKIVFKAFVITMSIAVLVILFPVIMAKIESLRPKKEVVRQVVEIKLEAPPPLDDKKEEPPPPEQKPSTPPVQDMIKFTIPVITTEDIKQSTDEMPTMDELKESNVGQATVKGVKGDILPTDIVSVVTDPGDGDGQIFTSVEQQPEFPGGEAKLLEFIANRVKYPAKARDKNIQGKVLVRFVVGADGSVSNVTVVKSVLKECDDESLRVVKLLPKFKPGKQNGKAVPVWYVVPIDFQLTE